MSNHCTWVGCSWQLVHKQITWTVRLCTNSYFSLSSVRLSMLSGFLLSDRIFFFFSRSVSFLAPLFPSCLMAELLQDERMEENTIKLQTKWQNLNPNTNVTTDPLLDATILLSHVWESFLLLGIPVLPLTRLLLLLPLLFLLQYRSYNSHGEKKHLFLP